VEIQKVKGECENCITTDKNSGKDGKTGGTNDSKQFVCAQEWRKKC
jgi:hypothetical protein